MINLKKKLGLSTIPKKYYDSVATEYDNDYGNIYTETSALAYEQITKHLQTENPKVLDIAAGTGNILAKLQQKYPNAAFTANDASKNMLAITKEKIGKDRQSKPDNAVANDGKSSPDHSEDSDRIFLQILDNENIQTLLKLTVEFKLQQRQETIGTREKGE